MRSALYYPHTEIQSKSLLKTSLLLWDNLEFIVPNSSYRPQYKEGDTAEAVELIGKHRPLSDAEKQEAHDRIEEFATRQLPPVFYYRPTRQRRDPYEIYSDKLLMQTWQMLRDAKLAGAQLANTDYPLDESTGLSIMSILADCRAGETLARVTDQGVAYATVTNLLCETTPPPAGGNYEVVVPLTLKLVNATDLPLSKLIDFRKRESKSSSSDLRNLRHRYVARIEDHAKKILAAPKEADRKRLEDEFETDMKDDLNLLRTELREVRTDALLSKDIVVSAVAALTAAAAMVHGFHLDVPTAVTLTGAPVTVGGLLSTRNKYGASRRSIMQKHPMAYLYEVGAL